MTAEEYVEEMIRGADEGPLNKAQTTVDAILARIRALGMDPASDAAVDGLLRELDQANVDLDAALDLYLDGGQGLHPTLALFIAKAANESGGTQPKLSPEALVEAVNEACRRGW